MVFELSQQVMRKIYIEHCHSGCKPLIMNRDRGPGPSIN